MPCESHSGAARSERAHCSIGTAPALRGGAVAIRNTAPALRGGAVWTRYTSGRRDVSVFGAAAFAAALLVPTIGALGCASATPQPPPLDAAFARIQVHEAAIERARLDVQRPELDCEPTCAAARSAQREQADLCAVAREVDDRDALTRCRRAHGAAASVNAQAARRCRCR
jgi:hypothetical protein